MDPLKPHTQQIIEAEIARLKRNADPDRPKERVGIRNQKALLDIDPRRVLINEVEVFDDLHSR
jgi:hypothetical protein